MTLTPTAWNEAETDASGSYFYRLASNGSHSLSTSHPLFNQWSSLTRNITSDTILPDVYLPPLDNLVVNGDFETSLDPWVSAGNLPAVLSSNLFLTGGSSVQLDNQAPIPAGVRVDSGIHYPFVRKIERGPDGSLHAIWTDYNSSVFYYYAYKPPSGDWTVPVELASSNCSSLNQMDLAVDDAGIAHVTWLECQTTTLTIMYSSRSLDGSWSTPMSPSGTISSSYGSPKIAVAEDLCIYLVWSEPGNRMYSVKPDGGTWSAKTFVPGFGGSTRETLIAVDSIGTLHLISASATGMLYINRASDGTWSTIQPLDGTSYLFDVGDMTVDSSDLLHLTWISLSPIYYMERNVSGVWSVPVSVNTPSVYTREPSISNVGDGDILIGWQQNSPVETHFRILLQRRIMVTGPAPDWEFKCHRSCVMRNRG